MMIIIIRWDDQHTLNLDIQKKLCFPFICALKKIVEAGPEWTNQTMMGILNTNTWNHFSQSSSLSIPYSIPLNYLMCCLSIKSQAISYQSFELWFHKEQRKTSFFKPTIVMGYFSFRNESPGLVRRRVMDVQFAQWWCISIFLRKW